MEHAKHIERFDCTIIGGGIVGLAIARELSRTRGAGPRNTVLLERNRTFGMETSSRNSEVIHAGIYYKPGSLKARLCVEGKHLLYEYCTERFVPHRRIGKLIVGSTDDDAGSLGALESQAKENGVDDLAFISQTEIAALEPAVSARLAIVSPSTGIVDSHTLMKALLHDAEKGNVICAFNSEVSTIAKTDGGYRLEVRSPNDDTTLIDSAVVINAAGLRADTIAAMVGIDIQAAYYSLSYLKGEYFSVNRVPPHFMKMLVYPPPLESSLGIHTVLDLAGRLKLGPSAFPVAQIDYAVDPSHAAEFYESAKAILPFITPDRLSPDMSGIRPKRTPPPGEFPDFIIREESDRGFPGFINLIGMESPALTSCLAIARMVAALIE